MKLCENCQNEISEGNQFCTKCGTKVEIITPVQEVQTNICSNCKSPISDGNAFCTTCGNKIENTEAQNLCTNCNNPIAEGNAFCTVCGTRIGSNSTNDEAKLDAKQISNKLNRLGIKTSFYILTFVISALSPFLLFLPQVSLNADVIIVKYDESYNWFKFLIELLASAKDEDGGLFLFIGLLVALYFLFYVMQIIHSITLLSPWTSNKKISFSEIETGSRKCRKNTIGLSVYLMLLYLLTVASTADNGVTCSLTLWAYLYFISAIASIVLMFIGINRKNNNTN